MKRLKYRLASWLFDRLMEAGEPAVPTGHPTVRLVNPTPGLTPSPMTGTFGATGETYQWTYNWRTA